MFVDIIAKEKLSSPWEVVDMDRNLDWFAKADLSQYEDEYVAIAEEKVVAHGDDPEVVYNSAKKTYPDEEVVLWKVPKGDFFIFWW